MGSGKYFDPARDPYPPGRPVRYSDAIVPVETSRAKGLLLPTLRPVGIAPLFIDVEGKCPRCAHHIGDHHAVEYVVKGLSPTLDDAQQQLLESLIESGELPRRYDEEWVMRCNCGEDHDGHPDGDESCGSRFTVRVDW